MTTERSRWLRWSLVALFACAVASTLWFGMRSYRSWDLLRSAYALAAPDLGNLRAWMTLGYVSALHGAPEADLLQRLQLPPETAASTTLRSLARRAGVAPLDYVRRVQQAIAAADLKTERKNGTEEPGWLSAASDELMAALLVYGYPALAAALLVASIGMPLPSGLLTAAAGSLVAQQRMDWAAAGGVAVAASVAGDMAGFYLGRLLGAEFLEQRGPWIGYTAARRRRVQGLFERWGLVSVLLSRTLVSSISSVVNLGAGASRYGSFAFLSAAVAGRILWTAAYLGLGYGVSGALEAANGFLANLTGLLVSLALAFWSGVLAIRRPHATAP